MIERADYAVEMIVRGWAVFPVRPNDKRPLTSRGFKDAHQDPVMARTFLAQPGQPNYGIVRPLGEANPVGGLDLDGGDGRTTWKEDWAELVRRLGPFPLTFTDITPSRGRHVCFRWRTDLYGPRPPGDKMFGFTVRWPWAGYLVGPGSVVDGKRYESNMADIVDLPRAWALAALEEAKPKLITTHETGKGLELPARVSEGGRYEAIRTLVAQLYNRGLTPELSWPVVRDQLVPRFAVGLPESEVRERFDRAWSGIGDRLGPPRASTREERAEKAEIAATEAAFGDVLLKRLPIGAFPADPDPIAFDGLAGEAVSALLEQTTASQVGLLASVLAISGVVLSVRTEYHGIQPSSVMVSLVGETAIGRKGTAMNAAWRALTADDAFGEQWDVRIKGMGSGEGLVGHGVREAKDKGLARMLLMTGELAEILAVKAREGQTLGILLRDAFDREQLANITKGATLRLNPDQYQLGLLAGITPDELRELVAKSSDIANGFANRILFVPVVGREGSVGMLDGLPHPLAAGFAAALAASVGERHRPFLVDDVAWAQLDDYYAHLAVIKGVPGSLARRFATIAARIGLIHTALDRADAVDLERVQRGIALTEYARAGMHWIWGAATAGSADAERLLRVLLTSGQGMKRSQLGVAAWRGHWNADRLDKALDELERGELIDTETVQTPGRPAQTISLSPTASSFTPFVPRAHAKGVGDTGRGRVNGADVGHKGVSDQGERGDKGGYKGVENPVQKPVSVGAKVELDEPALQVSRQEPIPWRAPCHFYRDHQPAHVIRDGFAICTICDPDPSRWLS